MQERIPSRPAEGMERPARATAVGYATRPGDRRPLQDACRRLQLELLAVLREPEPHTARPVLRQALDAVSEGRAGCLVVRRLADLEGGPGGMEEVLRRVEEGGLRLVALDVGLDTAEPTGRLALRERRRADPPPAADPGADPPAMRSIGYACAPRGADGDGTDLAGHRTAIEQCCEAAGLELVELVGDREPAQDRPLQRPGLAHAMRRLARGDAGCLVVARLDHLSHSAAALGEVVRRLQELGARLVAVDQSLDTGTEGGAAAARVLATIGGWERERLSERTRAGLRAADAKRRTHVGPDDDPLAEIRHRIAAMRAEGMTLQAIADVLNAEGVPTQRGGREWRPSSVQTAAGYRRPTRPKDV